MIDFLHCPFFSTYFFVHSLDIIRINRERPDNINRIIPIGINDLMSHRQHSPIGASDLSLTLHESAKKSTLCDKMMRIRGSKRTVIPMASIMSFLLWLKFWLKTESLTWESVTIPYDKAIIIIMPYKYHCNSSSITIPLPKT